MFYTLNHENKIEQGDICYNLPKFLPSDLISEEPTESIWDNYIESLRNNKIPAVKFSILPSPKWGVILSQTCDIENAKENASMIIAELNSYKDYHNIKELSSKTKKKDYIEKLIDTIRNEPAKHYFPELDLKNAERYGPWELDFRTIFFVPIDLVKNNKDIFWRARLISPGVEVLKEKISRFFTRLAFEECVFFSNIENEYYIDLKKRDREKIMKIRRECGFKDMKEI